jgi:hypothetical protein
MNERVNDENGLKDQGDCQTLSITLMIKVRKAYVNIP